MSGQVIRWMAIGVSLWLAQVAAQAGAEPHPGRKLYTNSCARCHGIDLKASSSAFFDLRTFPKDDKERFVRSVTQGLRAMPSWKGILPPDQIELIWSYIGDVNGWANKPEEPGK